jgi:hypothetical protein
MGKNVLLAMLMICFGTSFILAVDWTQLQSSSDRLGRTGDQVAPGFRPRWLWLGPTNTIKNKASNAAWTGPTLAMHDVIGTKTTLPASVSFTLASFVQPVIAGGKVFVADQDGKIYGINADDGSTVWTKDNAGGCVASVAYGSNKVIAGSLSGKIRLYNAADGSTAGEISTDGPITSAPATNGTIACVGSMDGKVYCVNLADGSLKWTSPDLGAGIAGGLCMDANAVYVGAENMKFFKLDINTGAKLLEKKVPGQSFYLEWPVVYGNLVYVQAAPVAAIGSEYVMETGYGTHGGPMCDAADMTAEQDNILRWENGDANGGAAGWSDASSEWKHRAILKISDFTEAFRMGTGPYDGCGTPPEPVMVDNSNRVLSYWKTAFPTLCKTSAFGTNHTIDISATDQTTGRRIAINNGATNHEWYTWETDNLYGLTAGGKYLYLRQEFRGTVVMDLTNSTSWLVSVTYGDQDGGGFWNADIIWRGASATDLPPPSTTQRQASGRVGPAISGSCIYFIEDFALVCAEHQP